MATPLIERLQSLLAGGKDNALLRFSLGSEYLKSGNAASACEHLARALEHDPDYSAAWKLYGKALTETGRSGEALEAYRRGIAVAERKGDKQAAKEMQVFARRIERQLGS
ncbi:MAG: tetratricopeptide repeat protein [Burkholderiales bacterium]